MATGLTEHESDSEKVTAAVIAGVATAVAPHDGLDPVQISLLNEVLSAVVDERVDVVAAPPLDPVEFAAAIGDASLIFKTRVVQLMVLGELILTPIPPEVARRVSRYADALGVDDKFVRVARRYSQGAFGLAWLDLQRSGFAEHWEASRMDQLKTEKKLAHQLAGGEVDPALAERWDAFEHLPEDTLGRGVWEMYRGRGFAVPGSPGGASAYLAQHDFVHVLADYGTNLSGELEVFSLISRADPDPKGFAWLATLVGLFSTGYVADAGFFTSNLAERRLDDPKMHIRIADALRRGRDVCDAIATDLLDVDFHEVADQPVTSAAAALGIPPKSEAAVSTGSPGAFDVHGMSLLQQQYNASLS